MCLFLSQNPAVLHAAAQDFRKLGNHYLRGAARLGQHALRRFRKSDKVDILAVLAELEWVRLRAKFKVIRVNRTKRAAAGRGHSLSPANRSGGFLPLAPGNSQVHTVRRSDPYG